MGSRWMMSGSRRKDLSSIVVVNGSGFVYRLVGYRLNVSGWKFWKDFGVEQESSNGNNGENCMGILDCLCEILDINWIPFVLYIMVFGFKYVETSSSKQNR